MERETERGKERKENGGSERASKIFVRTELSESGKTTAIVKKISEFLHFLVLQLDVKFIFQILKIVLSPCREGYD